MFFFEDTYIELYLTKDLQNFESVYNITHIPYSNNYYGYSIFWTGKKFALLGPMGLSFSSEDGVNWNNFSSTGYLELITSLYQGHDRSIACSLENIMASSPLIFSKNDFKWSKPSNNFYKLCAGGYVSNKDNTATLFWTNQEIPNAIFQTSDFDKIEVISHIQDAENITQYFVFLYNLYSLEGSRWLGIGSGSCGVFQCMMSAISDDNLKTWSLFVVEQYVSAYKTSLVLGNGKMSLSLLDNPGTVYWSDNGENWNKIKKFDDAYLLDSTFGNNVFVYLTYFYLPQYGYYSVVYDGETWNECVIYIDKDYPFGGLYFIHYDQAMNQFIVNGNKGYIYYSKDGCNWKSEYLGIYNKINVHQSNGTHTMIAGDNGLTMIKSD